MAEGPDNVTGRWQQFKTRALSWTLRTQIFAAIGVVALITVVVVGATVVIDIINPTQVSGVTLRFDPTGLIRTPGQTLVVDLVMDTQGESVNAVQAVFDIDSSRLDLTCTSPLAADCPDITLNPPWDNQIIADLNRTGDRIIITVGTTAPVTGNDIVIASLSFTIPATAPAGDATANFDPALSAVIRDDGLGTNIIDTVQNEEWTIDTVPSLYGITITSGPLEVVDCQVPEAIITWATDEPSSSYVAYSMTACPGCTYQEFLNAGANEFTQGPNDTLNHQVILSSLAADTTYYYQVRSVAPPPLTDYVESGQASFYTGCGLPVRDGLTISNLSVQASSRLALVTWNTNLLANSQVLNLSPANNNGQTNWFDGTMTLSHSLEIASLEPFTQYCLDVTSTTGPPTNEQAFGDICFTTETEDLSLDSNIVLKVNRDRICDQWLSCASSVIVQDIQGESRDLCFDYTLCEELDFENNGECTQIVEYDPSVLEEGRAIEFNLVANEPGLSSIDKSANLTGYSKVGARWFGRCGGSGNTCLSDDDCTTPITCDGTADFVPGQVSGFYPIPVMSQIGSSLGLPNGDFEAGFAFPWQPRFEGRPATVQTIVDRTVLSADFNNVLSIRPEANSSLDGALVPLGSSLRAGTDDDPVQYYVSMDVRTADQNFNELWVQLGFRCAIPDAVNATYYDYNTSPDNVSTDIIPISAGWQRIIAGPLEVTPDDIEPPGSETCLALLVPVSNAVADQYKPFYVDNIEIQPVLNAKPGQVDLDTHITRSCRQYPSEDAPVCRYFDVNTGRELQGWEGYCLQTDPRNERRCIQWAPIDLIAGSSPALAAYGQAGYGTSPQDRLPLYYCTQARGNAPYSRVVDVRTGDPQDPKGFLYVFSGSWLFGHITTGWAGASGLIEYNQISDKNSGRSLTIERPPGLPSTSTLGYNNDPIYIYDIEQIVLDVIDTDSDDWPSGAFVLNHANNFEVASCSTSPLNNTESCPEYSESLLNPDSNLYWRNVVSLDNGAEHCNQVSSNSNMNIWGAYAEFDDNGALVGLRAGLCDGSVINGWLMFETTFYLREWCTEIAQVVDPFGNNTAWAERVHNDQYSVPGLGYGRNRDLAPFGGIITPASDYNPSLWDYSEQERDRQPLLIEPADKQNFPLAPHQARASSPYGGVRDGGGRCVDASGNQPKFCHTVQCRHLGWPFFITSCSLPTPSTAQCQEDSDCPSVPGAGYSYCAAPLPGGPYATFCRSDEDCLGNAVCQFECQEGDLPIGRAVCVSGERVGSDCASNADCGFGDDGRPGRCTGVVPPNMVNENEFFAALQCSPGFTLASELFARSENMWTWSTSSRRYLLDSELGWDITSDRNKARPPRVDNISIKGGFGSTINSNGDVVFDNEFGKVTISFNSIVDPEQVPLVRYTVNWDDGTISEENNLEIAPQSTLPHVLTHTYICPAGGCTFRPRIQIEDNWGWCSGVPDDGIFNYSGDGVACDSWDVLEQRVRLLAGGASQAPTAEAVVYGQSSSPPYGTSYTVSAPDQPVWLDALNGPLGSSDPDGIIVDYSWRTGGINGTEIANGSVVTRFFNQASVPPGGLGITLVVTDDDGATDTDTVTINYSAAPPPPPQEFGWCRGTSGGSSSCASPSDCAVGYHCQFTRFDQPTGNPYFSCALGEPRPSDCTSNQDCNEGGSSLYNQRCFQYFCADLSGNFILDINNNRIDCEPGVYGASNDEQGSCASNQRCELDLGAILL